MTLLIIGLVLLSVLPVGLGIFALAARWQNGRVKARHQAPRGRALRTDRADYTVTGRPVVR